MNEPQQIPPEETIDVAQLARAIRFAFVALVGSISYFSIRTSLTIPAFRAIFSDMLNGKPLPLITEWVLSTAPMFAAFSIVVPIVAIATLFSRNFVRSFYILGGLAIFSVIQFVIVYQAMSLPLVEIIKSMGTGVEP